MNTSEITESSSSAVFREMTFLVYLSVLFYNFKKQPFRGVPSERLFKDLLNFLIIFPYIFKIH